MKYRKAVFVVTYSVREDKVEYLLLKRKLHWKGWEFPKGGRDKGEKILDTVKREIKEETGLKALKIKKFDVSGKYKYDRELDDRPGILGQDYKLFSAEVKKGKVKLDKIHKEHSDYKWVGFDKALKMLKWSNQRKCLRIVNKSLNSRS